MRSQRRTQKNGRGLEGVLKRKRGLKGTLEKKRGLKNALEMDAKRHAQDEARD